MLRQFSDRYAIRAGRNLPDKEFRYPRTVIVTAAVHRGYSSKLHPAIASAVFSEFVLRDDPTPNHTASDRRPAHRHSLPKHKLRNKLIANQNRASDVKRLVVSDSRRIRCTFAWFGGGSARMCRT